MFRILLNLINLYPHSLFPYLIPTSYYCEERELEKHLLHDYTNNFDCVHHNELWKILKDEGIQTISVILEKPVKVRKQRMNSIGTVGWIRQEDAIRAAIITYLMAPTYHGTSEIWAG